MKFSPHTEPQWPFNEGFSIPVAHLRNALHGAEALTKLLQAEDFLRDCKQDSGTPEEEAPTLNPFIRGGLYCALLACLTTAEDMAEQLGEKEAHK